MTEWAELAKQALERLGGRDRLVQGAKLRPEIDSLAALAGEQFGEFLRRENIQFGQFVRQVPGVVVVARPGTDILVGFEGAAVPVPPAKTQTKGRSRGFRHDVFLALTRIRETPYAYIKSRDEFVDQPGNEPDRVELPLVTWDELIRHRREFGAALEDGEARQQIVSVLGASANPIGAFHKVLLALGLSHRWHEFQMGVLSAKLEAWALENDIEPVPSWFQQDQPPSRTPQDLLGEFARYMSADEIRNLSVPFHAVEEMYRALERRRS